MSETLPATEEEEENVKLVESATGDYQEKLATTSSGSSTSKAKFFENTSAPCRPYLKSYPEKKQGDKKRSFNTDWYKFERLEYCVELDACFCFACRVFLPHSKEKAFISTEFKDWKHAKSKDKGLVGHDGCKSHGDAMKLWAERTQREQKQQKIKNTIVRVNSDQKQWLFAVFNVI